MFRSEEICSGTAGTRKYVPEQRNMGRKFEICSGAAKYVMTTTSGFITTVRI
ncbi:hypothetical protein SAMN05216238_105201 [Lentibacillus persicus]|uniref:Uncharacterized protein n=2 Tax=Lentibacillus persicus TaxID=640948 RepID=A0A1I1W984_9BACI|nr:hypothetical protein SAMN05216238_105201 [Lentibacillus persicus]